MNKDRQNPERRKYVLGVAQKFELEDSEDLLVFGRVEGTVCVGDAVYISNYGEDEDELFLSVVLSIENAPDSPVSEATDCNVILRIENGKTYPFKIGTVVFDREASTKELHNAYIGALGDEYIGRRKLRLEDSDIEGFSITDCAEVWRLFAWFWFQNEENEHMKEENQRKLEKLKIALCEKILNADRILCVYNKKTGEPHLFSKTINSGENYLCTPPSILIFPKAYERMLVPRYTNDTFGVREVENGEAKDGIHNFLGANFYLNGACKVVVIAEQVEIDAPLLVAPPDYSKLKPQNVPVTNPDLVRWMLLLGQAKSPETKDEQTIYSLYYRFMSQELIRAKLLIPVKKDKEFPSADEDGKAVIKDDTSMYFPTMEGKYGRPAVRMYTDWKRLRMVYDFEWGGLVQPIEGMIDVMDCAINVTQYVGAGCYIGKEMFEEMKGYSEKI